MLTRSAKYLQKVHLTGLISLNEAKIFDKNLRRRISAISHLKSFTVSIPYQYLHLSTLAKLRNALPSTIRHLEIRSVHRDADWKALKSRRRRWYIQQQESQRPPLDHQQLYTFVKHFPLLESFVFHCVPYQHSFRDLNLSLFLPESTIRRIELLDNSFDGRQIGWLADNCPLLNFVRITVHTCIGLKDLQKLCTKLILLDLRFDTLRQTTFDLTRNDEIIAPNLVYFILQHCPNDAFTFVTQFLNSGLLKHSTRLAVFSISTTNYGLYNNDAFESALHDVWIQPLINLKSLEIISLSIVSITSETLLQIYNSNTNIQYLLLKGTNIPSETILQMLNKNGRLNHLSVFPFTQPLEYFSNLYNDLCEWLDNKYPESLRPEVHNDPRILHLSSSHKARQYGYMNKQPWIMVENALNWKPACLRIDDDHLLSLNSICNL
ncbi:hypothetical protein Ddc_11092 [Ditylenchus destructor]|nr:hypothetical protein Ddc_11092 [Ditylenchus destructor]